MPRIASKKPSETDAVSLNLELRDLQVVLAVAAAGSTAGAARRLHLTQSAVSRALALAEARAEVALFTRLPRGLAPTKAGAVLLEEAPHLLAAMSELEKKLRSPGSSPQRLRFVSECYTAYPWLTPVVLSLRDSAPHLKLELALEHMQKPGDALAQGELDFALLHSEVPPGVETLPLFSDEIVLVIGTRHELAKKPSLEPSDLEAHPLFVPVTPRGNNPWFARHVFGGRRARLNIETLPLTEAILELARAGEGIGILSEWVVGTHVLAPNSGLQRRRLRSGPLLRPWRLAFRTEVAAAATRVHQAILEARPKAASAREHPKSTKRGSRSKREPRPGARNRA